MLSLRTALQASALVIAVCGKMVLAAEFERLIEDIHEKAESARVEKDFETVESLRMSRLDLIRQSQDAGVWRRGLNAIDEARTLVKRMRYEDACTKLLEAWRDCEAASKDGLPVFGDVAFELFLSAEAAKSVHSQVTVASDDVVRRAIKRAVKDDPCQVESLAADAFLTTPNPDEAFDKMESRPSLRARNQQLLALSYPKGARSQLRPWHAVVEHLKAENYESVLADLQYLPGFLNPRTRVSGRDRYGERFCVVLSGGLLVNGVDSSDKKSLGRPFVDILGENGQWLRVRPELVSVKRAGSREGSKEWVIDEGKLRVDVANKLKMASEVRAALALRSLRATTTGFPGVVANAIAMIEDGTWPKDWRDEKGNPAPSPQPGKPSVGSILRTASFGYTTYAANVPDQSEQAVAAAGVCNDLAQEVAGWTELVSQYEERLSATATAALETTQARDSLSQSIELLDSLADRVASASWLESVDSDAEGADVAPLTEATEEAARRPSVVPERARRTAGVKPRRSRGGKDDASEPAEPPDVEKVGDGTPEIGGFGSVANPRSPAEFIALDQREFSSECEALRLINLLRTVVIDGEGQKTALEASVGSDPTSADVTKRVAVQEFARRVKSLRAVLGLPDNLYAPARRLDVGAVKEAAQCLRGMQLALSFVGSPADSFASLLDRTVVHAEDVVGSQVAEVDLKQAFGEAKVLREWTVEGLSWTFFDVPRGVPLENLATWIDRLPRIAVSADDLDVVARGVGRDGDAKSGDANKLVRMSPAVIVSESAFVLESKDGTYLKLARGRPSGTEYAIALVSYAIDQSKAGPACDSDEKSRTVMWHDMDGQSRQPIFVDVSNRELVVEFAGVEGHLPLVARSNPLAPVRYLKDRRGTRIEPSKPNADRLFFMIADNGQELNDTQVNYSVAQWVDLDRNIINVFLPNVLLYGPSIPSWTQYSESLSRPAPADTVKWSVPRAAFPDYRDDVPGMGLWKQYREAQ